MKIKLLLFCLILPLLAMALRHAEILGVPIDGTISEFSKELEAEGIKTDWTSTQQYGQGEARWFTGPFYGRNCSFIAYYIPSSKIVYRVKVFIDMDWISLSTCEQRVEEIKDELSDKYHIVFEKSKFEGYTAWIGYVRELVPVQGTDYLAVDSIGWVDIYMSWDNGYTIYVDFYDKQNYLKNKEYLDTTF